MVHTCGKYSRLNFWKVHSNLNALGFRLCGGKPFLTACFPISGHETAAEPTKSFRNEGVFARSDFLGIVKGRQFGSSYTICGAGSCWLTMCTTDINSYEKVLKIGDSAIPCAKFLDCSSQVSASVHGSSLTRRKCSSSSIEISNYRIASWFATNSTKASGSMLSICSNGSPKYCNDPSCNNDENTVKCFNNKT